MALFSSLILLMLEKEIRVCFEVSWLVLSATVFAWVGLEVSLFLVGFVVVEMAMDTFFGIVPFLLSLKSVKILSFTIS